MKKAHVFTILIGFFFLSLTAIPQIVDAEEVNKAIAIVHPVPGSDVAGEFHINEVEQGLKISGELRNLQPGEHGFHIHEFGDCTAPNEGSVGPHYFPLSGQQGYLGDLPHIHADGSGKAQYEATVENLSLDGEHPVLGRAMLVHGLTGEKIGCAVIARDE